MVMVTDNDCRQELIALLEMPTTCISDKVQ